MDIHTHTHTYTHTHTHIQKYEEELVALEKQRGVDMKYIHPQVRMYADTLLRVG